MCQVFGPNFVREREKEKNKTRGHAIYWAQTSLTTCWTQIKSQILTKNPNTQVYVLSNGYDFIIRFIQYASMSHIIHQLICIHDMLLFRNNQLLGNKYSCTCIVMTV